MKKNNKNLLDNGSLAIIGFATLVVMNLGGVYGAGFYLFGAIIGIALYARIAKNMKAPMLERYRS